MKKILFLFFLSLCAALHADQLEWISLEQAKKAKTFLETQQEIIEYRACDDNPSSKTLKINRVGYRYTGTENYYQIYLLGKNSAEKDEEWATDLAYLYFNEKEMAQNVGKYLNFECDPCTESFEWEQNPLASGKQKLANFNGIWRNYPTKHQDSHIIRLDLTQDEEGRLGGQLITKNVKTQKEHTYIVEGQVLDKVIARLEVIERNKKGSFSIAWIEISLTAYDLLHWEKESGDGIVLPNAINLTTETY